MKVSKHILVISGLILLILITSYFTALSISNHIDKSQRAQLMKEAQQASLLFTDTSVASLAGDTSDLDNDVYNTLKQELMMFRSYNPSIRFVYLLGYKPEIKTQFFYIDSEPTDSKDYSAPGALFTDTRQQDIDNYLKGQPYTDGPYKDSWGEWVSGYAPIKNSYGDVVALLGIDMATSVWHEQINFVVVVITLIALLLSVISIMVVLLVHKKQMAIDSLEKENTNLVHKKGKLEELQNIAQIGRIVIYFPSLTFSIDKQFSDIFLIKESENIDKEIFLKHVHFNDQEKFNQALDEIKNSDISYTWVDIRLGTPEKGFRLYHIYGNIERNDSLAPIRFSGIIQDITDIHT